VKALLRVMDVFVLPSRWEGLPLAILEAMSTGLPVIASNIPGNNDLVKEGITGYLFEREKHCALADKLMLLLVDADKRHQFGLAARTSVFEHYQIENRVSKIEKLYARLLNQDGLPRLDESVHQQEGKKSGRTAVQ
jgi:glycosyltransferase involved in cell wall biosynthesis